jgi:hypothetical protein
MVKNYKEIDCTKTCRMTTQLRESRFCTKTARVYDDKIVFGCVKILKNVPAEITNHYSCNYWNMEMYDACNTCSLSCMKNDNLNLKKIQEQRGRLKKLMENAAPAMAGFGMTSQKAVDISKSFNQIENDKSGKVYSETAIKAAEFASHILNSALDGKAVDLAYFQECTNDMIEKIGKESGQKIEKIDFSKRKKMGLSSLTDDLQKLLNKNKNTK